MLQTDTVRAVATYGIAFVVIIGGGAFIFLKAGDPSVKDSIVVVAGFMGIALNFAFGSEVQTRTARQAALATSAARSDPVHANGGPNGTGQ